VDGRDGVLRCGAVLLGRQGHRPQADRADGHVPEASLLHGTVVPRG
jgi:hypothetical protein